MKDRENISDICKVLSKVMDENGGETNCDVLDTILEGLASDCRIDV